MKTEFSSSGDEGSVKYFIEMAADIENMLRFS
jgi:hypothetical protein